MSKKTGPQHGPYQQDNGAELPSRRRLLLGMGMMSGALALGGAKIARAAADCPTPESVQDERWQKQPFYGQHQAGVLTPQQAAMMLVAFDVLATDKAALIRLFTLLTK